MKIGKKATIQRKRTRKSVASEGEESGFTSDDFSSNEEDATPSLRKRTTIKRAITR